jgi:3'5'-cyclic nucleotide phosphodiesterase
MLKNVIHSLPSFWFLCKVETYWLVIDPVSIPSVIEALDIPDLRESDDIERTLTKGSMHKRNRSSRGTSRSVSPNPTDKYSRLVDWNVEILLCQLKLVCGARIKHHHPRPNTFYETCNSLPGTTILDEVQEVIHLPSFNVKSVKNLSNSEINCLPDGVEDELRDYITMISELYRKNPFHNFEHASHVTMSVNKLLSRIVQPTTDIAVNAEITGAEKKKIASEMHSFSYGITSDPLTHFACLFSALIHDVDHCGVPNSVLLEENPHLAQKYKAKSIAEQNSVDIAWGLLQRDEYKLLRHAIYSSPEELIRFRQLVVNSGKLHTFMIFGYK